MTEVKYMENLQETHLETAQDLRLGRIFNIQ